MSKCQNFISSLQYSIIFLISIGCGTTYAPGLLPPSMMGGLSAQQVLQEDSPEIMEWHEILKTAVNLLTKIDAIIEDILIMIHKGIMPLKNDEEAKRIISEIRMNVMAILHDQTNFLRVKKVEDLKRYCAYLMVLIDKLSDHLDTIVDSGFRRIQPFNFDLLHKRGVNTNISISSVKKQLITLNKQISELHEKEEYSNLAWYNIVARKFEKNIIMPWYQYKLGTAARVAFVSAATATFLLWQLGSVHLQNQVQFEIRNFAKNFGYQELIKNYPDIADKYPLMDIYQILKKVNCSIVLIINVVYSQSESLFMVSLMKMVLNTLLSPILIL